MRREWLEGADERIHEPIWLYKRTDEFAELLEEEGVRADELSALEAALLVTSYGYTNGGIDEAIVVLSVPVRCGDGDQLVINEHEVRRWIVCGDAWVWNHDPCRVELKLLGHHLWADRRVMVPIHSDRRDVLKAVRNGRVVPRLNVPWHIGGRTRLEDYCLGRGYPHSQEPDEWEAVMAQRRRVANNATPTKSI